METLAALALQKHAHDDTNSQHLKTYSGVHFVALGGVTEPTAEGRCHSTLHTKQLVKLRLCGKTTVHRNGYCCRAPPQIANDKSWSTSITRLCGARSQLRYTADLNCTCSAVQCRAHLDVAVDQALRVHVLQRRHDLAEPEPRQGRVRADDCPVHRQPLPQLASVAHLQQVVKRACEPCQRSGVRYHGKRLNSNLPSCAVRRAWFPPSRATLTPSTWHIASAYQFQSRYPKT